MLGTLIGKVREGWEAEGIRSNLWGLLRSWGPAWLVMIADVDAASVITAAESSALYGTKLIWFLLILTVPITKKRSSA